MIVDDMAREKEIAALASDNGEPKYTRRLGDKILTAFTHAYSVGRLDLSEKLLDVLNSCSEQDGQERSGPILELATCWMQFVQARNRFNEVADANGEDSAAAAQAFQEMKDAHQKWKSVN